MIDTHEPKDGDFVAYIEQLQKESAARLLGSGHHVITQLEKTRRRIPIRMAAIFSQAANLQTSAALRNCWPRWRRFRLFPRPVSYFQPRCPF